MNRKKLTAEQFVDSFAELLAVWIDMEPQKQAAVIALIEGTLPRMTVMSFAEAISHNYSPLHTGPGRPKGESPKRCDLRFAVWQKYMELAAEGEEHIIQKLAKINWADPDGIKDPSPPEKTYDERVISKLITESRKYAILLDEWEQSPNLKRLYPQLFKK